MSNKEHLAILKQGVDAWNQWRRRFPKIQPDLSGANLSQTSLVILDGGDVIEINLGGTNLQGASLFMTNLLAANLREANLRKANLIWAQLFATDLRGADLRGATLINTLLDGVRLDNADFNQAVLGSTVFAGVDLSTVKGLEAVIHRAPSTIGIDTIIRSQGSIPEAFLRKAGVPPTIIKQIPALIGSLKPIDYYTCFISYSSKDQLFVERLYADLQARGVLCWFAPEDMKWGSRIRSGINEAIHSYDKLLLILSKNSIASEWVEREVKIALAREKNEKRTVLFPVRLDKAVLDSPLSWATNIRHERNIGDFTSWKNHDAYQKAFERLLRDLKAST